MQLEEFAIEIGRASSLLEVASFKEQLVEAGKQFGNAVADNFARNEDSDGNSWAPHSQMTIKQYGPHPLLRLTWAMFDAATDLHNAAAIYVVEDREIEIGIDGNELPYAAKQDQGAGRIPKREFFYLNDKAQDTIGKSLEDLCMPILEKHVLP